MTEIGWPSGAHETTPAAPFTSAGRAANPASRRVNVSDWLATAAVADLPGRSRRHGTAVGSEHDVRVEHREQLLEVTAARGGEEGIDDRSLLAEIRIGNRGRSLHPATGPARELSGCGRGAPDDGSDLIERHGEHVVKHERDPLGGSQPLEDHEQCQTDRVGQEHLVLGIDPVSAIQDRLRHVHGERLLAPRLAGASMFRHTRATTVVSHPPMFSTSLVSARLVLIQASWTASSASEGEPSIR